MLARLRGSRRLVDALDRAVRNDCETTITDALRLSLCRLMQDREVILPECVYRAASDHYARREIYRSEELGYSVIAMTCIRAAHPDPRSLRHVVRRGRLARADRSHPI